MTDQTSRSCPACSSPVPPGAGRRARVYCTDSCRKRAARARASAAKPATPAPVHDAGPAAVSADDEPRNWPALLTELRHAHASGSLDNDALPDILDALGDASIALCGGWREALRPLVMVEAAAEVPSVVQPSARPEAPRDAAGWGWLLTELAEDFDSQRWDQPELAGPVMGGVSALGMAIERHGWRTGTPQSYALPPGRRLGDPRPVGDWDAMLRDFYTALSWRPWMAEDDAFLLLCRANLVVSLLGERVQRDKAHHERVRDKAAKLKPAGRRSPTRTVA